ESPLLQQLQGRMGIDGHPPSVHLRRLDRWAGLAELRTQFPLHFFVNIAVLWDLHVLRQLERWNRDVGRHSEHWFDVLGEIEALAALSVLPSLEPSATFPEMTDDACFEATDLAHPLLPAGERV